MCKNSELSIGEEMDRIIGDRIILYDKSGRGPGDLKTVEIINDIGEKKTYTIKKTVKGGYLFN